MTTSDTISENELNELFIFMNSDPMNEFIYYADLAKWRAKIIILIPIRHRPVSYYSYSVKSAKITSFLIEITVENNQCDGRCRFKLADNCSKATVDSSDAGLCPRACPESVIRIAKPLSAKYRLFLDPHRPF